MKQYFIILVCLGLVGLGSAFAETEAILSDETEIVHQAQGELHVDVKNGFEIRGPKGWSKEVVPPLPGKTTSEGLMYRKQKEEKAVFPMVRIIGDTAKVTLDCSDPLDCSQLVVKMWGEAIARNQSGTIKVIEEPHELEINGAKVARTIIEMTDKNGKSVRTVDYKFMMGSEIMTLMGVDWSSSFDDHLKDFEETASSFRFIKNN